jgi:hypothetical protein
MQTSELPKVLVLQQPEMKHSVCTLLHVLPRATVVALNLQDNCFQLLEPHQQVHLVGRLTPLFMETYVPLRLRAERLLEMQQLPSTRHLERLLRTVKVLNRQPNCQQFRSQQQDLVEQPQETLQLVCIPHQERQLDLVFQDSRQLMTKTQYQALLLGTGVFRPLLVEMK